MVAGHAGLSRARFEESERAAYEEAGLDYRTRYVTLAEPQMRMRISEVGEGDPVVFIHGGNSVGASFIPLLPHLAPSHRLVIPDRPGCGLTDSFDYRGVDLREHGVGVISSLLDSLGLERAALVGNSMGGYFALAFALASPDRVSRLALVGEPANAEGTPRLFHRLVGTRRVNTLLYRGPLRPPSSADGLRASFAKGKLLTDPDRVTDALGECLAAGAQIAGATTAWTTMVEQIFVPAGRGLRATDSLGTHKLAPELPYLEVPTLFLWGDQDPLGSPETGRVFAESMPSGQLEVVADAGHLPWIDQPKICADALASFLA